MSVTRWVVLAGALATGACSADAGGDNSNSGGGGSGSGATSGSGGATGGVGAGGGQGAAAGAGGAAGTGGTGGAPSACAADQTAFDAFVAGIASDLMANSVPGGAVMVVCGGSTVFTSGIGIADTTTSRSVDDTTRFQLASTTKMLTGLLGARLHQEGVLSVDDLVSKWVPFVNTSAPYATGFTLAHLLSHTSGYPAGLDNVNYASLEGAFQANAQVQLWAPPGAVFNYSNDGTSLAGLTMQKAAGMSFAQLIEQKVFAPAKMTTASMDAAAVEASGTYALGYSEDGSVSKPTDSYLPLEYYGPMGGAWATASDMAALAKELIAGGGDLLDATGYAAFAQPRVDEAFGGSSYGLGTIIDDLSGTQSFRHSGSVGGFLSEFQVLPSRGFAVAVLVNSDRYLPEIAESAYQTFVGEPMPYSSTDASYDPADVPDHLGTYESPDLGTATVTGSAGALMITVGGSTVPLMPVSRDNYYFNYAPAGYELEAKFQRVNGTVKYLVTAYGVGTKP